MDNPFQVKVPDEISADDVVDLFVDVFADFNQVLEKGHTFLNGHRGSGKSMMFRFIMPDCQKIACKKELHDLDFFALYIPIKKTDINIPALEKLKSHEDYFLSEHLLATYILSKSLNAIVDAFGDELNQYTSEIQKFHDKEFLDLLLFSGYKTLKFENDKGKNYFINMSEVVSNMLRECMMYCKSYAVSRKDEGYFGPLLDFINCVYPFLIKLKQLSFFAKDRPFYILIDDAGHLTLSQTRILNTWVSYRTTGDICFKISTQLDYKTHLTINGKRIDSPHDYSEVNISTRYSSKTSIYSERIEQIVKKRINKYLGVPIDNIDVKKFFPENQKQKQELEILSIEIKEKYKDIEKSYAGLDANKRYTVSEYVKSLKQHRSGYNYSYSGFDQLVSISSGIFRQFLEPAQRMYLMCFEKYEGQTPDYITDSVQNSIIKVYSEEFLTVEFDKIRKDKDSKEHTNKADMLFNLINSLGELFHKIFVSDLTERIVFSIALTTNPNEQLKEILDMGEQYGYLHKGTIGNKQGTGRNPLYILSRLLAPYFKLDSSSFSGYQNMTSETLSIALNDKNRFLRAFDKKFKDNKDLPSLFNEN